MSDFAMETLMEYLLSPFTLFVPFDENVTTARIVFKFIDYICGDGYEVEARIFFPATEGKILKEILTEEINSTKENLRIIPSISTYPEYYIEANKGGRTCVLHFPRVVLNSRCVSLISPKGQPNIRIMRGGLCRKFRSSGDLKIMVKSLGADGTLTFKYRDNEEVSTEIIKTFRGVTSLGYSQRFLKALQKCKSFDCSLLSGRDVHIQRILAEIKIKSEVNGPVLVFI